MVRNRKSNHVIDFDHKIIDDLFVANKHFGDIGEFLSWVDSIYPDDDNAYSDADSSNSKWVYGSYGLKKSREILSKGDPTKKVLEFVENYRAELQLQGAYDLQTSIKSCKRRRRYSEDGENIDIDRYLCDDIQMWETIKRDGKKEYIKLAINFGQNGDQSEESFARNTAITFCTAEILENLGYSVEIVGTACSKGCVSYNYLESVYGIDLSYVSKNYASVSFTIKKSEEYTDVGALTSTSLTSLFRKWGFNARKTIYGKPAGSSVHPPQEFKNLIGADIFIGNMRNYTGSDVQTVEKIVRDVISK